MSGSQLYHVQPFMEQQKQQQQQQQHGGGSGVEILNLTSSSVQQLQRHQTMMMELEAKKMASSSMMDVPTLPNLVRKKLRELGLPVRLFGENLANVRDRLRYILAKQLVEAKYQSGDTNNALLVNQTKGPYDENEYNDEYDDDEEEVTKYTRALPNLITARQEMTKFSIERATIRLQKERSLRKASLKRQRKYLNHTMVTASSDNDDTTKEDTDPDLIELDEIDNTCLQSYKAIRQITLEGSQYGDSRTVSCICSEKINHHPINHSNSNNNSNSNNSTTTFPLVATGSWNGSIQLWDGSSPVLTKVGERTMCHDDRIMGIAIQTNSINSTTNTNADTAIIATASIDLTARLWKVSKNHDNSTMIGSDDPLLNQNEELLSSSFVENNWTISPLSILKGHGKRLCRVAFHPMKKHVATTSFDHSWRLWDIETEQTTTTTSTTTTNTSTEILLQDGHSREVYGIGFHPDGSLCSTTDFAGVVQVWDIRCGKSIRHFLGHARRVFNTEFHPVHGFQLATGGDDGTIRIWDLRKRKQLVSIPAHSNMITNLKFDPYHNGEYLASSSFDGTIKLWNTRDWKQLNRLQGHDGKVTGVTLLENHTIISCGFDKTLKMWR